MGDLVVSLAGSVRAGRREEARNDHGFDARGDRGAAAIAVELRAGTAFEKLMVRYFELDPTLTNKYDEVRRWIDWPRPCATSTTTLNTFVNLVQRVTTAADETIAIVDQLATEPIGSEACGE